MNKINKKLHKFHKFSLLFSFVFFACSKSPTLNMKEHEFGVAPKRIIWFQVAGLTSEQLALLRFSNLDALNRTDFEKMNCTGQSWAYNLFSIRTTADLGFWSQILGKKSLKGQCNDFSSLPIWKYLEKDEFKIGIFESLYTEANSISKSLSCPDVASDYLSNLTLWKMNPFITPKKLTEEEEKQSLINTFHSSKKQKYQTGKIYFDQSCNGGGCYSSLMDNVFITFESIAGNPRYLYLVRDFSYLETLKKKEILKTREALVELNKILHHFLILAKSDPDMLVLITSSNSINIELPEQGSNWLEFEKEGRYTLFHNSSLLSPVFSYGARAENFCGIFEQSEMLMRIMKEPTENNLEKDYFKSYDLSN